MRRHAISTHIFCVIQFTMIVDNPTHRTQRDPPADPPTDPPTTVTPDKKQPILKTCCGFDGEGVDKLFVQSFLAGPLQDFKMGVGLPSDGKGRRLVSASPM